MIGAVKYSELYAPVTEAYESVLTHFILPIAALFLTVVVVFAVYLRMTKKAAK